MLVFGKLRVHVTFLLLVCSGRAKQLCECTLLSNIDIDLVYVKLQNFVPPPFWNL